MHGGASNTSPTSRNTRSSASPASAASASSATSRDEPERRSAMPRRPDPRGARRRVGAEQASAHRRPRPPWTLRSTTSLRDSSEGRPGLRRAHGLSGKGPGAGPDAGRRRYALNNWALVDFDTNLARRSRYAGARWNCIAPSRGAEGVTPTALLNYARPVPRSSPAPTRPARFQETVRTPRARSDAAIEIRRPDGVGHHACRARRDPSSAPQSCAELEQAHARQSSRLFVPRRQGAPMHHARGASLPSARARRRGTLAPGSPRRAAGSQPARPSSYVDAHAPLGLVPRGADALGLGRSASGAPRRP